MTPLHAPHSQHLAVLLYFHDVRSGATDVVLDNMSADQCGMWIAMQLHHVVVGNCSDRASHRSNAYTCR